MGDYTYYSLAIIWIIFSVGVVFGKVLTDLILNDRRPTHKVPLWVYAPAEAPTPPERIAPAELEPGKELPGEAALEEELAAYAEEVLEDDTDRPEDWGVYNVGAEITQEKTMVVCTPAGDEWRMTMLMFLDKDLKEIDTIEGASYIIAHHDKLGWYEVDILYDWDSGFPVVH